MSQDKNKENPCDYTGSYCDGDTAYACVNGKAQRTGTCFVEACEYCLNGGCVSSCSSEETCNGHGECLPTERLTDPNCTEGENYCLGETYNWCENGEWQSEDNAPECQYENTAPVPGGIVTGPVSEPITGPTSGVQTGPTSGVQTGPASGGGETSGSGSGVSCWSNVGDGGCVSDPRTNPTSGISTGPTSGEETGGTDDETGTGNDTDTENGTGDEIDDSNTDGEEDTGDDTPTQQPSCKCGVYNEETAACDPPDEDCCSPGDRGCLNDTTLRYCAAKNKWEEVNCTEIASAGNPYKCANDRCEETCEKEGASRCGGSGMYTYAQTCSNGSWSIENCDPQQCMTCSENVIKGGIESSNPDDPTQGIAMCRSICDENEVCQNGTCVELCENEGEFFCGSAESVPGGSVFECKDGKTKWVKDCNALNERCENGTCVPGCNENLCQVLDATHSNLMHANEDGSLTPVPICYDKCNDEPCTKCDGKGGCEYQCDDDTQECQKVTYSWGGGSRIESYECVDRCEDADCGCGECNPKTGECEPNDANCPCGTCAKDGSCVPPTCAADEVFTVQYDASGNVSSCSCAKTCGDGILGPCEKCEMRLMPGADTPTPTKVYQCDTECQKCVNNECVDVPNYDQCVCESGDLGEWCADCI